ncbi:MAG: hypothetical protein JJU05_05060 [Verrucomicrobia bacterium]|nr:hypothetical protein [Verrucomicrobiota bacterium]MCH8526782.1 hypothetical protein [Kiritimatiellia bacterium]
MKVSRISNIPVLLTGLILCFRLYGEDGTRYGLAFWEYGAESFQDSGEAVRLERRRVSVEGHSWGYVHDYRAFGFPERAEQTVVGNGHVHRTGPVWRRETDTTGVRIAPALAVSSNVLRDQRDLRIGDIEPAFSVWRRSPGPGEGAWRWGLIGDTRTGAYRVLPVLGWESRWDRSVEAALGFPDSSLQWRMSGRLRLRIEAGPDGGVWHVRDRAFTRRSRLEAEGWRLMTALEWMPASLLTLGVFWETGFARAREWRVGDLDGGRVEVNPPDAGGGGVSLRVLF